GLQRVPDAPREERLPGLGGVGGERSRGDRRAARSPVVHRRAVPPGVPVAALGPPSPLRRLRRGGVRVPGATVTQSRALLRGVALGIAVLASAGTGPGPGGGAGARAAHAGPPGARPAPSAFDEHPGGSALAPRSDPVPRAR